MEKRENKIAAVIVDAAMEVHRTLGGPGLFPLVPTLGTRCKLPAIRIAHRGSCCQTFRMLTFRFSQMLTERMQIIAGRACHFIACFADLTDNRIIKRLVVIWRLHLTTPPAYI